jgi:peptide/nickel transport system permease protein
MGLLSLNLVVAAIGPLIAPYGYAQMATGTPASGMSFAHPFGTDQLGRDVFSRALYGGHIVIALSFSGTALGLACGGFVGMLSGLAAGWTDTILMRICEVLISIPFLILALIAILIAGPSWSGNPILIVFVIGLVYFPRVARMARAAALEIATRDYVMVARMRGESLARIAVREILPNATGLLLVEFAIRAGYAPVLVGALGFLGFGMRPPTPEWGLMMSEYRGLLGIAPATVLGPGLMLASLVIGLNLFTEGLARALESNWISR